MAKKKSNVNKNKSVKPATQKTKPAVQKKAVKEEEIQEEAEYEETEDIEETEYAEEEEIEDEEEVEEEEVEEEPEEVKPKKKTTKKAKAESVAPRMMTPREKRKAKKAEKREKRRSNSRIYAAVGTVSSDVKAVRTIYREVGRQLREGYVPTEEPIEEETVGSFEKMEHSRDKFTVSANPTVGDLFKFLYASEFRTASGIFSVIITLAAIILFFVSLFEGSGATFVIVLAIMVAVLIIFGPGNYYIKALSMHKQMVNNGFSTYCFSNNGFDITNASGYVAFTWDEVYLAEMRKDAFYIYLDVNDGFPVLFEDLAKAHRSPKQLKELLEKRVGDNFTVKKW